MNEGHVIDDGPERLHNVTEELAAFTVGTKCEWRFHPRTKAVLKGLDLFTETGWFAVMLFQLWLVVPKINVTGGGRP
jgi:hypothetical protein